MTEITKDLKDFTPRYCAYLYKKELEEITNNLTMFAPKWKKDVLIVLLEKSLTVISNRKATRKKVLKAVNKATDLSFRKMRRAER